MDNWPWHATDPGPGIQPLLEAAEPPEDPLAYRRGRRTKAVLRMRIFTDQQGTGLLSMYAASQPRIGPTSLRVGELLAHHAALVLGRSDAALDVDAMDVQRWAIERAVSTLMERYRLDEDRAYEYLVRTCQHSSLQLPELAREVTTPARR